MSDFDDQLGLGLSSAETTFGHTFTISTSLDTFSGIFEYDQSVFGDDIGDFDTTSNGILTASKPQFTTANVTPEQGDSVTVHATTYVIMKVNEDDVSYELILRWLKPS